MASTISVNFATPEEVYIDIPPAKKSISAKTLSDVLGGGVVGGGYIQLTGTLPNKPMTGFLALTSLMPREDWYAAPKKYVDDHAYTRRYFYEIDDARAGQPGFFASNTVAISGLDKNTTPLYFFEKSDTSYDNAWRYVDVYRNGILQSYPSDYTLINVSTFYGGTTAIKFETPLQQGANVQVSIGNVGAYPTILGVHRALSGFATRMSSVSGDVTIDVIPEDLAATSTEIKEKTVSNRFISPTSIALSPHALKAKGLFRKANGYDPGDQVDSKYGSPTGVFDKIISTNISSVVSDPDNNTNYTRFRVYIDSGTLDTIDYIAQVSFNVDNGKDNVDFVVNGTVDASSRTLTSFDFFVYDSFYSKPIDVYEINITII